MMPSKNIGSFLAFDEGWFHRHQRALLWLLNCPVVSLWFRWVLRIRACDCGRRERITAIGPNRFVVALGAGQYRADFRTHWKYSKRVYFAFRPLWWALHGWDSLVGACRLPKLAFGFDTLTVYPDPHPEQTSVDGYTWRGAVNETFAAIHAGAGTDSNDAAGGAELVDLTATSTQDKFFVMCRAIFLFNTAALTAEANILAATFSLYDAVKQAQLGKHSIEVVASTPASNTALVAADYSQLGAVSFASMAYDDLGAANDFPLNASGLANISKTGISKFGTRTGWDLTGSFGGVWASGARNFTLVASADTAGTASDPKLVVTYTLPPSQAPIQSVSVEPSTVIGGDSATGTVTLVSPAPAEGVLVTLSSDNEAASVPASITIAAGLSSGNFEVTTSAVETGQRVTLTATSADSKTTTLTVNPPPPPGMEGLSSIRIDGHEYIQAAEMAETEIVKDLGGRMATCALGLDTADWPVKPPLQGEVTIWGGDPPTRHFAGYVSRTEPTQAEGLLRVTCQDYTRLLDTVVIESELFTSQSDKAILTYLLEEYLPEIGAGEIEEVAEIPSLELTDVTLREAIERIVERTGAEWYVDFDKNLRYYAAPSNPAPFGLSEDPDGVSTVEFLREGFTYSEDFSNPANRVMVLGKGAEIETGSPSFSPGAGADDGHVYCMGAGYPPTGDIIVVTGDAAAIVRRSFGAGEYRIGVGLVRFDTSPIPDDAVIVSASLRLYVTQVIRHDPSFLGVEWYNAWPIDAADYTATPSNSAAGYIELGLALFPEFQYKSIPLSDLANISKDGYTGFRLHVQVTGTPTNSNSFGFATFEAAQPPILEVAWTRTETGAISAIYDHIESQTFYGRVFSRTVLDRQIQTEAEALLRAQTEAARYAWPQKSGVVKIYRDGLDIGQLLSIDAPTIELSGDFLIRRLAMRWVTGELVEYTVEFGDYRPDLITLLRKLAASQ